MRDYLLALAAACLLVPVLGCDRREPPEEPPVYSKETVSPPAVVQHDPDPDVLRPGRPVSAPPKPKPEAPPSDAGTTRPADSLPEAPDQPPATDDGTLDRAEDVFGKQLDKTPE